MADFTLSNGGQIDVLKWHYYFHFVQTEFPVSGIMQVDRMVLLKIDTDRRSACFNQRGGNNSITTVIIIINNKLTVSITGKRTMYKATGQSVGPTTLNVREEIGINVDKQLLYEHITKLVETSHKSEGAHDKKVTRRDG